MVSFFPENDRALRMVVEKLLRLYISNIHDKNDMDKFLEDISQKSKTAKANLIKVMFLVMMFKRAECEGDWPLDLHVDLHLHVSCSSTCTVWLQISK